MTDLFGGIAPVLRSGYEPPKRKRGRPRKGLFSSSEAIFAPPAPPSRELINSTISLLERQRVAVVSRDKLMDFTKFTMPSSEEPNNVKLSTYQAARFHEEIADALEQVERGEIRQLIFCMPPRHGKTQLATKSFAAWYSGRHPRHNIAVGTYADTMAEDIGADTRGIMGTTQFKQVFPRHALQRGGTSKTNMQTEDGGRLVFVGRGGALTGKGAHLLLLDDLFKDDEEAQSQGTRNKAWNWFTKVAMTRRMGRKLVVITMTRWHSDDIIGRLTDKENPHYNAIEAKKWKIIRLPAIAEDDDPLGRAPGQALWPDGPDQFDLEFLESQRRLDPLGFEALYQQRPTVADGVLFRRETISYYEPDQLPKELRYYCASDHAVAVGQRNDYTVMLKVGIDRQGNIYIVDCYWRKVKTNVAVEQMINMGGGLNRPLIWWGEKGQIEKSIGPFLYDAMRDADVHINMRMVAPVQDKEQRAQSIAALVACGRVYFPKSASWTERAIEQLMAFPNGTHDDFVDALAYIGLGLRSQIRGQGPSKQQKRPKYGTLGYLKEQSKLVSRQRRQRHGGF